MVPDKPTRTDIDCNGVTKDFTIEWPFLEDSHLKVILTVIADPTNVAELQLGVHYTVTGAGLSTGGAVHTTTAYASTYRISIIPDIPFDQQTEYEEGGDFPAKSHEGALDKLTMLCRQLKEGLTRAVKGAENSATGLTLPPPENGRVLGWVAGKLANVVNVAVEMIADLASTTNSAKGAGMSGFAYALTYAANTVGKAIKDVMDRATALEALPSPWNTGDTKETFSASPAAGWVNLAGGTIGDATSGADRANADCSALFTLLWGAVANDFCPVLDSAGAISTRGATAADDWAAHKRLTLPDRRGRVAVGAGTGTWASTFTADAGTDQITLARAYIGIQTGQALVLSNSGGALPAGLAPGTYYAIRVSDTVVQLASSLALALAGTAINITGAGTGTHTATLTLTARAVGQLGGEEAHATTVAEMPAHTHTVPSQVGGGSTMALLPQSTSSVGALATSSAGSSSAHNNIQPFVVQYVHIKL